MPLLSDEEIESRLGELDGWSREGDAIRRSSSWTTSAARWIS